MTIEIVDFPIKHGDFPHLFRHNQRVVAVFWGRTCLIAVPARHLRTSQDNPCHQARKELPSGYDSHSELENHHVFYGKIYVISMVMFNSYVTVITRGYLGMICHQ